MNSPVVNQNLGSLLQIENDAELIGLTCPTTGLPIWPLIRVPLIRMIMSDWLFKSESLACFGQRVDFAKFARCAANSAIHNLYYKSNRKRKILIQSTGLGNYNCDGLVHDRLIGYFAEALSEQTLVYQDKPKEHLNDKYSFSPVLHKTPRNIINKIYSRLVVKYYHRNLASQVVNRAVENASSRLGYEFSVDRIMLLINLLADRLAALPYASDAYANMFSKHSFKLLLKEDACYGGNGISIIHAARLSGMVIAEYQHGAISKGHDAYNVADALVNSDLFRSVLPDYLLTYGNWWSNQTNMPISKIAIGNPHFTETVSNFGSVSFKKNQVLVLGDGIETDLYLNLCSQVLEIVKKQGGAVVFRPHPFEREKAKHSLLPDGVQLDLHPDIYSSLKNSRVVISELSTGLFEAVGMVEKVLMWDTDKSKFAFPDIPFVSFSTMSELETVLNDQESAQKVSRTVLTSELWKPNWKQNYLDFVEGVVGR